VLFEASGGKDLIRQLNADDLPDVVLLDIRMPEMDGYETAQWLKKHYPQVAVLALSTMDDETSIIKMIQNGAKGYILKNADSEELKSAIYAVLEKGYFYNELVTGKVMRSIGDMMSGDKPLVQLNEKERE